MPGPDRQFWQDRFERGQVPWDRGGPGPQLLAWLDDGTLDHIGQLSHVSRPSIGVEPLLGLRADRGDRLLRLSRKTPEEESRQLENVVPALA